MAGVQLSAEQAGTELISTPFKTIEDIQTLSQLQYDKKLFICEGLCVTDTSLKRNPGIDF